MSSTQMVLGAGIGNMGMEIHYGSFFSCWMFSFRALICVLKFCSLQTFSYGIPRSCSCSGLAEERRAAGDKCQSISCMLFALFMGISLWFLVVLTLGGGFMSGTTAQIAALPDDTHSLHLVSVFVSSASGCSRAASYISRPGSHVC